jgi:ketosteroid isomerase-like protein
MSANLELVRSWLRAWERGDYASADWADPEIEYVFHDGPEPGRWRGVAGMAQAWFKALDTWEDYASTAEKYLELDDERVLVLTRASGRGRTSGIDIKQMGGGKGALLRGLRAGKVTQMIVYWERDRAFAELGITPEGDAP